MEKVRVTPDGRSGTGPAHYFSIFVECAVRAPDIRKISIVNLIMKLLRGTSATSCFLEVFWDLYATKLGNDALSKVTYFSGARSPPRHGCSKLFDRVWNRLVRCIDYDVVAVPRQIFTGDNFFPGRQSQPGNTRLSCFHALTVSFGVGTEDLNLDKK